VCACSRCTTSETQPLSIFGLFSDHAATRIINEVRGINRVVYEINSEASQHGRVGVRGVRWSRTA
jgi:hypothetical protein